MFETFYQFFRSIGSEGIAAFALLSYTLYGQLGCRYTKLNTPLYVLLSTLTYASTFLLVQEAHIIPYISLSVGQTIPYWFFYGCMILVSLLWAQFCLGGSFFEKLTYTLYFISLILLYKQLCSPLYQMEGIMPDEAYRIWDLATCGLELILLYLLVRLFHRLKVTPSLRRMPKTIFMTLYFPVSFILCYCIIWVNPVLTEQYSYPAVAFIILTNLPMVYYLVVSIINAYEEQRKLDTALTQTQAELDGYRCSIAAQEQVRKERHELKNRYFYLQTLLREKQYDQAEAFLAQQTGQQADLPGDIATGNPLLDYLLNCKTAEARKQEIKTYTEIVLPANLQIDETSLCSILANLLDNAIEASRNEKEADLQIVLNCTPGYLTCRISNRISEDIAESNPELHTTKADTANHGYGLKIVQETVAQCEGMLQLDTEHGYFTAKVMLPLAV